MADNTILPQPTTTGDTIRTVAKTATGAKASVALIDVGGGADSSPEAILTLGQATKALSLPVTLASDQGAATDASLTAINATLLSQAVATSTKGNPAPQILTVQPGNEVLLAGPFTRTDASSPFFLQELDTDGLSYCSVGVYVASLASGASVVLQGTGDPAASTGWTNLRMQQPNSESTTSTISPLVTVPGTFEADCAAYRWLRAIHLVAPTSGSTTLYLKFNRQKLFRQQTLAAGTQNLGLGMNGGMTRVAVKAAQSLADAVSGDALAMDLISTVSGAIVTNPYAPPEVTWAYAGATGGVTATGATAIAAAPGAGERNFVRSVQLKNVGATATEVTLRDGGTVIWTGFLPAAMTTADNVVFDPALRQLTLATAINLYVQSAGAQIYCGAQGWVGP